VKLISNEVERFVLKDERDDPNPTVFGIRRIAKGRMDRLQSKIKREENRKSRRTVVESAITYEYQKALWRECVPWVENVEAADGSVIARIEDRAELDDLWDNKMPSGAGDEIAAYIMDISELDEDEVGNSSSERVSTRSESSIPTSGAGSTAKSAKSAD